VDEKTKAFIRAFFENVCVNGITRHLEFEEEPAEFGEGTTVKLLFPSPHAQEKDTVYLGFPEDWKPPIQ
jgi:hypothetical protein